MNRINLLLGGICLVLLIQSCGNSDYQRKKDGLIYRIISSGQGEVTKPRTYLKIHQRVVAGDSVLFSSFEAIPSYGFFDSLQVPTHDFLDILHEMRVGDSAIVLRSVDSLQKKGELEFNEFLKRGSTIKVYVKLLGTFKSEAEMKADQQKVTEGYKVQEIANLEKYVADLKLKNVVKTPEGVFVVIEKEGTGMLADSGRVVKVKYTGKVKDGQVFDSNIDPTFGHTEPFTFTVGQRQVIDGWDVALKQLHSGAKAKIFIPSLMGYGSAGSPPKIPPYSILIFEIEVLEVGAAALVAPAVSDSINSEEAGQGKASGNVDQNH